MDAREQASKSKTGKCRESKKAISSKPLSMPTKNKGTSTKNINVTGFLKNFDELTLEDPTPMTSSSMIMSAVEGGGKISQSVGTHVETDGTVTMNMSASVKRSTTPGKEQSLLMACFPLSIQVSEAVCSSSVTEYMSSSSEPGNNETSDDIKSSGPVCKPRLSRYTTLEKAAMIKDKKEKEKVQSAKLKLLEAQKEKGKMREIKHMEAAKRRKNMQDKHAAQLLAKSPAVAINNFKARPAPTPKVATKTPQQKKNYSK